MQLDAPAGAVRLLLHAPHANRFNTAEQVSSTTALLQDTGRQLAV